MLMLHWLIKIPEGTPNESSFTPQTVWMYPVLTPLVVEVKWTFLGPHLIPRITWALSRSRNSRAPECWWNPLLMVLTCTTQHYPTNLDPVKQWKHLFSWPLCENLFVSLCSLNVTIRSSDGPLQDGLFLRRQSYRCRWSRTRRDSATTSPWKLCGSPQLAPLSWL